MSQYINTVTDRTKERRISKGSYVGVPVRRFKSAELPRHHFETLADHMAEPEKWLHMLREPARTTRKQLELTRNNI